MPKMRSWTELESYSVHSETKSNLNESLMFYSQSLWTNFSKLSPFLFTAFSFMKDSGRGSHPIYFIVVEAGAGRSGAQGLGWLQNILSGTLDFELRGWPVHTENVHRSLRQSRSRIKNNVSLSMIKSILSVLLICRAIMQKMYYIFWNICAAYP